MRIQINGKDCVLPSSLSEMTLSQRIDFHNKFGKELEERAIKLEDMEDENMKEIETTQLHIDSMFAAASYFLDIDRKVLEESEYLDTIASLYYSSLATLLEQENNLELKQEYVFNDEIWTIQAPELKNGSMMTFGEFVDSKQIVKDLLDLGSGKWEAMLYLCAIFLRKVDEPYNETLIYDGSERLELMKSLPMDIALAVGFFLTASLNGYINTYRSSLNQPPEVLDQTALDTTSVGAG